MLQHILCQGARGGVIDQALAQEAGEILRPVVVIVVVMMVVMVVVMMR